MRGRDQDRDLDSRLDERRGEARPPDRPEHERQRVPDAKRGHHPEDLHRLENSIRPLHGLRMTLAL